MRIELDERIIKILTCALNAESRYTSVTVTFRDGEQKVDTLYTSPSYGAGTHFLQSGNSKPLDEVLSIAQSFESLGDIKSAIKALEKKKRENLSRLEECKGQAKDLDQALTKLLKMEK